MSGTFSGPQYFYTNGEGDGTVSIPTTDDAIWEFTESLKIHVRADFSSTVEREVEADIYDNDEFASTTYAAEVSPAVEGSNVVLTVEANTSAAFQYYVENVSAIRGTDFGSSATSWTAVGTGGQVVFPTSVTAGHSGTKSFKVHVRVAGMPDTEMVLEGDIYDQDDALVQRVEYAYDAFNQLVRRTLDDDGPYREHQPADTFYSYQGGQIVLQFDGPEAANLSHRYLWGPAVDQLLADEQVSSLTSAGSVLWPLADHLGTIRDLAVRESGTTKIVNHREYDSFGNLVSESNEAVDEVFGYTGKLWDEATKLQNNLNRWYDPKTGRWLSEDPIGFGGGDTNLQRYVGNNPINFTDPSGLASQGDKWKWRWNWHHLLDKAIFDDAFMKRHGLDPKMIHQAEYGWMLRGKDHIGTEGIHSKGWSDEWKDWIKDHERKGTKITKEMIDEKLQKMIKKYRLADLGSAAKYCYSQAEKAHNAADRLGKKKAAGEASDLARKLGRKGGSEGNPGKGGKAGGRAGGFIIGILISFGVGVAMGSDDPLGDALDLDPLDPSTMGDAELKPDQLEYLDYLRWQHYQDELDAMDARR